MPRAHLTLATLFSLAAAPLAHAGVGYTFTINQSTSALTYSFSANAPFGSGGTPAATPRY